MDLNLHKTTKIILVIFCFGIAIIGFMLKLPRVFRHYDKELHAAFYFFAGAFLNILFTQKKPVRHLIIFILLFLFGAMIEYAQAYSNKFFHTRIHGRFDPEDLWFNTIGLLAFSACWIVYYLICLISKSGVDKDKIH